MENQNQELVLMVEQVEALKQAKPFVELMMYNRCAIREIETKLRVLDEEFSILADRNPIQTIKSRVKKPISIIDHHSLAFAKFNKSFHLAFKAFCVVVNVFFCKHLSHIGTSRGVAYHCRTAADKSYRGISRHLQTLHKR